MSTKKFDQYEDHIINNEYPFRRTPLYMAPEVMAEALYDGKADLWSLGCILYEANFGKPPIVTQSISQLLKWHRKPEIAYPTKIAEESKSFLDGLLKKDPEKRLTWKQIVEHPYVKGNLFKNNLVNKSDRPLTEDLTISQQIRKEKQRDEIIFNRGQKMIAEAMSKCQQTKSKPRQKITDNGPYVKRKQSNIIGDNEPISSDDSINAIIQTDLETDVEGPLIKRETKPPIKPETTDRSDPQNENLIVKRYMDNFAAIDEVLGEREEKDNVNLKIGTMLENIEKMQLEDESKCFMHNSFECDTYTANTLDKASTSNQIKTNTELEKRKLSQHLENFSIRLNDLPGIQGDENDKDSSMEKSQW